MIRSKTRTPRAHRSRSPGGLGRSRLSRCGSPVSSGGIRGPLSTPSLIGGILVVLLLSLPWAGAITESLPIPLGVSVPVTVPTHRGPELFLNDVRPLSPADPGTSSAGVVTPGSLRSLYGINGLLNGTAGFSGRFPVGENIGVLVWGNGYDPTDIQDFLSNDYPSNFPRPHVIPVNVDGAPAPGPQAWNDPSNGSLELTLDIEWALSAAPGANIYAFYAPASTSPPYKPTTSSLEVALSAAVNQTNLSVLSLSWGEPQGSDPSFESIVNSDLQILAKRGVTVVAASGDDGGDPNSNASQPCQGPPNVDFPAASPWVLAVGGANETSGSVSAWSLSGGGFSPLQNDTAPIWQKVGTVVGWLADHPGRGVPDVAASAVDDFFFYNGTPYLGDGTSFAAPFWAGIVADLDKDRGTPLGLADPAFYPIASVGQMSGQNLPDPFFAVTSGQNCVYPATPGWDPVTGWGVPNATALFEDLSTPFLSVNLTLSGGPPYNPGTPTTATVTLPNGSLLSGGTASLEVYSSATGGQIYTTQSRFPGNSNTLTLAFSFPSGGAGTFVNVTVLVIQGPYMGVASMAAGPQAPSPPAPPGFQFSNIVPYLLDGLFVALLFLPFWFLTRRRNLAASAPPGPAPGPPLAPSWVVPSRPGGASPQYTPFCWRCGQELKGTETTCPSCHRPLGP
jgi:subtilase family serine protease